MRIRYFTVSFSGSGSFSCTKCSNRIWATNGMTALLIKGEWSLLLSAVDGSVIHKCGRRIEWHCPDCSSVVAEPRMRRVRRGKSFTTKPNTECSCGGTLSQREVDHEQDDRKERNISP